MCIVYIYIVSNTTSVLSMDSDERIFHLFMFCIDPTKISAHFTISRI